MKGIKITLGFLAIFGALLAIAFVLKCDLVLVTHPKGIIAQKELELIVTNILLMLIVVVPTLIALFVVAWRYRERNPKAHYDPERSHSKLSEALLWIIPSCVIAAMSLVTWKATHELDPYVPLKSDVTPLEIQVIALDWKWLFIYPEQGIATIGFIQFPARVPIHFSLSADGSPMNSFWLPELSGQIYSMSGMTTPLYMMADKPGVYAGRAAEINGAGYADMTFTAQSSTQEEFDDWVLSVKESPHRLTHAAYEELLTPSAKHPVTLYSYVEENLYHTIIMKYMHHE